MRITYADSWKIASEIVDMLAEDGLTLTIQEQERISRMIHKKHGKYWNDYYQEWLNEGEVMN